MMEIPTPPRLVEGHDYYFNPQGLMVLTREYLLHRGTCCQSGCTHCPYGFIKAGSEPAALTPPHTPTENEDAASTTDQSRSGS